MADGKTISEPDVNKEFVSKNTFTEHGNEIDEIISKKPPFMVRWGTLFLFFLLLFIICISWFIQYPDIVNTTAKLTSINAPKPVITLVSGKLVKLNVSENQTVNKNEILGFLESTADHQEVILLLENINNIQLLLDNNKTELLNAYFRKPENRLGELQNDYQVFVQTFLTFRNYLSNGFYVQKKKMLAKDLTNMVRLHNNLYQQKGLHEQDMSLSQKTFDANQSLKNDNVISDFDLRNETSKLIGKKLTLPQITSSIISNESQQDEKKKEIAELENTIAQQKAIFQQALNSFKSQTEDWKKKYLLIAPIDGKVAFATFIQENQQLQANQIICFVNPANSEYYAQTVIPQSNFGKVAAGQKVLLKFSSYPSAEYGAVMGKMDFISHIPTDSGYLAKVIFTNGLHTNYNKQIQYREGLTAQAEIITKDRRLLQRFYDGILNQVR